MSGKLTCVAVAFAIMNSCYSQESIKVSEAAQIKFSAKILITHDLNELLNLIANSDTDPIQLKDLITNSYIQSYNRVFDSSIAIIEDDIDPAHTLETPRLDMNVKKYLDNLDALYTKSPTNSIVFTWLRTSNVKSIDKNTYVKIYFNSFFRNKNKTNDTTYTLNNRVAEVFVRKVDNRWKPLIASIRFFNASDTVNDLDNDILLERDAIAALTDSLTLANQQKTFEQQLRETQEKDFIENENKKDDRYKKLIEEGDKERSIKNFTAALKKYSEAKEVRPYLTLAQAKITSLNDEKERAKLSSEQLFNDYYDKAKRAKNRRSFKEALEYYRNAKEQDPLKATEFEKDFQALESRYRILDDMDEMYRVGQYSEAIAKYSSIIKKNKTDKDFSDYYNGRGKCYEKTDEYGKAASDYAQAIALDRDNVEAYINLARIQKRNSKYLDAISNHKAAIMIYKENSLNYLELSELRVLLNQRKDAISILEEGLKVESLQKLPDLYLRKGLLLAEDKSWQNALTDFTSVVKIDSNLAFGYYNRGLCYLQLKQVDNAASDFETARQKILDSAYIKNISAQAENYFERSSQKYLASATDSAIILVNIAIKVDPYNNKYWYNKGEYYHSQAKYSDAIKYYDEAVRLNPLHTDAFYKLGLCYHLLGNYKTAVENYKNSLALSPNYTIAIKALGDSYFALDDFANAAIQYELAIKLITGQRNSNNELAAEVYNSLGKSYYQNNDLEASITNLRNAIRKKDNFAEAYFNRGLSYYKQGKLEDAISDFTKAISLESKHVRWNYYLAKAYQDNKNYIEATQYYTATISLDTDHQFRDAVLNRGSSFYESKDFKSALPDYLDARKNNLDTSMAGFDYQLGMIYLNMQQPDPAIECFEKLYARDSTNGLIAYGMGSALVQKGKNDDALPWFDKALLSKSFSPKKLKNDPLIGTIQSYKPFKDLLKKY